MSLGQGCHSPENFDDHDADDDVDYADYDDDDHGEGDYDEDDECA